MRSSDWSSDVCSADLVGFKIGGTFRPGASNVGAPGVMTLDAEGLLIPSPDMVPVEDGLDRKSVGSGKSVSVRVDVGGRRIVTKKKKMSYAVCRIILRGNHQLITNVIPHYHTMT